MYTKSTKKKKNLKTSFGTCELQIFVKILVEIMRRGKEIFSRAPEFLEGPENFIVWLTAADTVP